MMVLGTSRSRTHHLFEIWSDWLRVRVRIGLIASGSGLGLLWLAQGLRVEVRHYSPRTQCVPTIFSNKMW